MYPRLLRYLFVVAVFSLSCSVLTATESLASNPDELRVYPGYVVQFDQARRSGYNVDLPKRLAKKGFDVRHSKKGLALVLPPDFVRRRSAAGSDQVEPLPFDPNDTTCKYLLDQGALSCSPNYELRALATPNDSQYSQLWGMRAIDAPSAWNHSTGSDSLVVAVIDTGIDYNHPDLQANMWRNPAEVSSGVDSDGNGYIDDIFGINARDNNGNPMDDNGHGTHVAGTIGAVGNNGIGVAGVNWNVKIMALKFLAANGSGSLLDAIEAIDYMTAMRQRGVNIRISNNSWGGGGYSQALYDAIGRARSAGIIFVAAAGNESNNNDVSPAYPAGYQLSSVVPVAAIDSGRNLASFSNYGANTVKIAAPGVSILSTYLNGTYRSYSGTSMATPHVAGALALLLASEPQLTNDQAIARLYGSAQSLSSLNGLVVGGRSLNVGRMLNNEGSPVTPPPVPECSYTLNQAAYSPDRSADSATVVMQADEASSYYQLDLPFQFPFFSSTTSRVYISPNGVVYSEAPPLGQDYQNHSQAAVNSIAALHTDLISVSGPQGVRVSVAADKATIYWLAQHYWMQSSDPIEVRLTLHSNGSIEKYISFGGDSQLAQFVSARATIGITGSSSSDVVTHSYNSTITDNLGLTYTRSCSAVNPPSNGTPSMEISKIKLRGVDRKKTVNYLVPKKKFRLEMQGIGDGVATVRVGFDRISCEGTAQVSVYSGHSLIEGRFAVAAGFARHFRVFVDQDGVSGAARIKNPKGTVSRRNNRNVRTRRINNACRKVLRQIH